MDEKEKNSLLSSYSVSDEAIRKLFMDCEKIELYVLENNRSIITGLIDTKKIIEKTIFADGDSNIYEYKYRSDKTIQQIISKHYKKDDNQSLNPKLIIRTEDGIEIENKKTEYDSNEKKKNEICIIYYPDTKITKKTEIEYENGNDKKRIETEYDANGKLTKKIEIETEYDDNGNDKKKIWTNYNSNGKLTEKIEIEYDNGNEKKRIETEYDANEKLTEKIEIETEYDDKGNEKKRIDTYYNANGKLTKKTETEYDENGNKKKTIWTYYNANEKLTKKTEIEYENGNKKKTIWTYYNANEKLTEKIEIETEYDDNGNEKKRIDTYYNANGELTKKIEIETEYDDNGNKKKRIETEYDANGKLTEKIEIEYDNGNEKKRIETEYYANGKITKKTEIEYDNGNEKKRIDTKYNSNGELTKKTETEYDALGKPTSQIYQEYTGDNENTEAYRSATFNEDGVSIVKDKKGNVIKYNKDSDIDIAFAGINNNRTPDIIDKKIIQLCKAINKEYKKEIAIIHTDIVDKDTIDDAIDNKLKDNQVLFLSFKDHQVCVAKIGGKLFSVGMYNNMYRATQDVENTILKQSSRNGECVNLAEIMALFSAKWISERGEKNPETAADDFRWAIKKFAIEYQNEKLYDYYADETLKLRHFIDLPDSVKQKIEALEEYNKLSDDDKKNTKEAVLIKNHNTLSNGVSRRNNYGFLGNIAVTQKNSTTKDDISTSYKKIKIEEQNKWQKIITNRHNEFGSSKEI